MTPTRLISKFPNECQSSVIVSPKSLSKSKLDRLIVSFLETFDHRYNWIKTLLKWLLLFSANWKFSRASIFAHNPPILKISDDESSLEKIWSIWSKCSKFGSWMIFLQFSDSIALKSYQGSISGGTLLKIRGSNLNVGSKTMVYLDEVACQVSARTIFVQC